MLAHSLSLCWHSLCLWPFCHLRLLQDALMLCRWLEDPWASPWMWHRSIGDVKIVGQKSALRMMSFNVSTSSSKLLATDNKKSPTERRAQVSKQKCPFGWEKHEGMKETSGSNPLTRWEVSCPVWVNPTQALLHLPSAASTYPHHQNMGLIGRGQRTQEITPVHLPGLLNLKTYRLTPH